jgi:hypothetical protein
MSPAFWVWLLMVLWLIFGCFREYRTGQPYLSYRYGFHALTFVVLVIIIWHDFGSPQSALIR